MPARFPLTRRRLLQGGLALGAVNLGLPAIVRAAGTATWFKVEA